MDLPAAVAVGSFPGTSPLEPERVMAGETPELPCIPELPDRGPGGEMIGRSLGLLSQVSPDFVAETTTTGWRVAGRGLDADTRLMRRARSWLMQDLDTAVEQYQGAGAVKCAMAGPWTLAASVELTGGHRLLRDPGAVAELVAATAQAASDLTTALRRHWPTVVVQLDEPLLPAVLAAAVSTPSGLDRYRAVGAQQARDGLAQVCSAVQTAGGMAWLHSCAVPAPIDLIAATGVDGISLDLTGQQIDGNGGHHEESLGRVLESEVTLMAGIVAVSDSGPATSASRAVESLLRLLERLGIALPDAAGRLAVSTPCGLAGYPMQAATAALRDSAEAARILAVESGLAPQDARRADG